MTGNLSGDASLEIYSSSKDKLTERQREALLIVSVKKDPVGLEK